jgi:hypothetical protein
MKSTHARRPGESGQGGGVPGGGPVVFLRRPGSGLGGAAGQGCGRLAPQGRRSGPGAGGRAWG